MTKRRVVATVLAGLLLLGACGDSDSDSDSQSDAQEATTTSDGRAAYISQVDAQELRHGLSDAELHAFATEICAAAKEDAENTRTGVTGYRGNTGVSARIGRLYAGTDQRPFSFPIDDAKTLALLVGRSLCPEYNQQISLGADKAKGFGE